MVPTERAIVQNVAITATGFHTPSWVMSNDQLIERFGLNIDSEWIESRTGIESRHWLEDGRTTSDMAAQAAMAVLDSAGLEASALDRIILATISGDYPNPSTASILARKIGARCMAFDLSAACAGFMYALDLGVASVRNGAERVLVVAADARSRFIDKTDRRSVVLFGDAAAGVLLEPSAAPGFLSIRCGGEGREDPGAWIPAGGAALPTSQETMSQGLHHIRIAGKREIFQQFVDYTLEICAEALGSAGLDAADIDLFITHQGNARLVELLARALGLPPEKTISNIAYHGNTAGAALPLALAEAWQQGRLRKGDRLLLSSVGAGTAFGAAVYQV